MSAPKTVYLNLTEITEIRNKDVFLKDVADILCSDSDLQNRLNAIKVKAVREDKPKRYIESALDVISKMEEVNASIQVVNVGKVEYIIDYIPPCKPSLWWQWIKTVFVCFICFFGAAFAIMTFNNDVSVTDVFKEIYLLVMGQESPGFTVLEISYSIGLALGIIVFFNHFAKWKLNTDPTPLEVEMRLYEDNVCKTLIQNDGRKEQEIDVQ